MRTRPPKKILIVDDEKSVAGFLSLVLSEGLLRKDLYFRISTIKIKS